MVMRFTKINNDNKSLNIRFPLQFEIVRFDSTRRRLSVKYFIYILAKVVGYFIILNSTNLAGINADYIDLTSC